MLSFDNQSGIPTISIHYVADLLWKVVYDSYRDSMDVGVRSSWLKTFVVWNKATLRVDLDSVYCTPNHLRYSHLLHVARIRDFLLIVTQILSFSRSRLVVQTFTNFSSIIQSVHAAECNKTVISLWKREPISTATTDLLFLGLVTQSVWRQQEHYFLPLFAIPLFRIDHASCFINSVWLA